MSVVGGDWEKLKRFNLAELYASGSPSASRTQPGAAFKAEAVPAMPESVTTDETSRSHPPAAAAEGDQDEDEKKEKEKGE